jgi:apolipoprotein N-acyltransferase
MASNVDRKSLTWALIAVALSALAWWHGSSLHPQWWATWLAPLPVLLLAPRVRARWAAAAAFTAYAAGAANQGSYLHGQLNLPLPVIALAIIGPGITFALCTLLFRRLLARRGALVAALAVPALWVAFEWGNTMISPHGTFGSISYTQMDVLPLVQLASVSGLWGISFLLLFVPSALAAMVLPQIARRERVTLATLTTVLLGATLGYGIWRLQAPATTSLRIGLVSLELPIRPALDDAQGRALEARYLASIDQLASAGARVVVLPETSFGTADANIASFAAAAQRHDLSLDIGIAFKGDPRGERNMSVVFAPDGNPPVTYSKHHLIPGFEKQYTPGDSYAMLAGDTRIGLAICKDLDFHDIGLAYAARRAQLLLVPAWDFGMDGWLHSRMAIMRGVESGFAVARAARTGRLTLSDDRGRVVAEASSEQHDATLVGDLPLRETHTLYTRWGNWFVWLNLAGLLVLPGMAWRRERH